MSDVASEKPKRPAAEEPRLRTTAELDRQWTVRACKRLVRAFTTNYHDLRILTPFYATAEAGGILACNHTASLDPLLLQTASPRTITWMMAREYSHTFGLQWFFRAIEPIMVDRSGRDMAATRSALRALKVGRLIGLFPEGRIETKRELLEFQTGVALLAIKANVPVYPAFIDGPQRGRSMVEAFFSPTELTVAFGPPIRFDPEASGREALEDATAQIRAAIEGLSHLTR
ncbi:MAG TPA: lysophospholipid acyltransferase family protein [Tepidisphaeraceae bacterium]|nr:lysophospholipid acyltransferase family protein [Tepidisphaeraceae bacterium]